MRHGREEMSTTERTGPRLTIPEDEENRIVRKAQGELKRGGKDRNITSRRRFPYTLKKGEAG